MFENFITALVKILVLIKEDLAHLVNKFANGLYFLIEEVKSKIFGNTYFEFHISMNTAVALEILKGETYGPGTGRKVHEEDHYTKTRSLIEKELGHKDPVYGHRIARRDWTWLYGSTVVTVRVPIHKITVTIGDSWGRERDLKVLDRKLTRIIRRNPKISDDKLVNVVRRLLLTHKETSKDLSFKGDVLLDVVGAIGYLEIQYGDNITAEDIVSIGVEDAPEYDEDSYSYDMFIAHKHMARDIETISKDKKIKFSIIKASHLYSSSRGYRRWMPLYEKYIQNMKGA